MGRYIVRRLLQFIPTVLGAIVLLHYLTSVAIQFSGNPVRALFGDRNPGDAAVRQLSERLGLDDPCLDQKGNPCLGLLGDRLSDIFLHFDFGVSLRFRPVTDMVADAFPYSLRLALIAFAFNAVLGIAAGVWAGLRGGSMADYFVKMSTVVLIAVPIFVLGVVVREFVGVKFGNILRAQEWLPDVLTHGVFTPGYKQAYPWASLIIPGLVLGAINLATTARLTRTSLMENLRADYVRTARAKGLTRRRVTAVHTLRNSMIPVVTSLGVDLGVLIGGAVVTETIFNVPGIGRLVAVSARNGESTVVLGIVTLLVLVYMVTSLVVDLFYAVLDPRIRYE